jgi:hypothetical protein
MKLLPIQPAPPVTSMVNRFDSCSMIRVILL